MIRLSAVLVLAAAAVASLVMRPGNDHRRTRAMAPSDLAVRRIPAPQPPVTDFAKRLLDRSTLRERDRFVTPDGQRYVVYEGRTADRTKICEATEGAGFGTSGCAPGFSTTPVIWGEAFAAGPGGKDLTDWHVSGLAAPSVARLVVTDSTGRSRTVRVGKGDAFFFALPRGELKQGVRPETLEVYGTDGDLLQTEELIGRAP